MRCVGVAASCPLLCFNPPILFQSSLIPIIRPGMMFLGYNFLSAARVDLDQEEFCIRQKKLFRLRFAPLLDLFPLLQIPPGRSLLRTANSRFEFRFFKLDSRAVGNQLVPFNNTEFRLLSDLIKISVHNGNFGPGFSRLRF